MSPDIQKNLTLDILRKAEKEKYGVLAQVCYDANSVIGLIRAAERKRSPAILQLFPVTLMYGKGPFLQFCLDAAKEAKVPVSVHLDHATDAEHLEFVLELAQQGIRFDSIMVDASHAETDEENILIAKPYISRSVQLGIAVEVELGRLEGGEAGLRALANARLTDPHQAESFLGGTGAHILAPSIGNLHGEYLQPPNFRIDIIESLKASLPNTPICLHGTDGLPDSLFQSCIAAGVSKITPGCY
ncbi:aldolase [Pyrrhoderma noxium]|uniref:Fructose-bisphosphate aldolase n=1 Tax=Pyrrhoderma noxium TaxID=2282107 RepID=A0A286U7E9_9AGAM|nr:aldolase [Pyrrhoderma noxium]